MGAETFLYLTVGGVNVVAKVSPNTSAKHGDKIKVTMDVNKIHLFDKETEVTVVD